MFRGQASQDIYCLLLNKEKRNGYFLEIGANHPIDNNNTYVLEKEYGWRGIMVEYDQSFTNLYSIHRPLSTPIISDATKINYEWVLEKHQFPNKIDYLQIDLDADNRSTLCTLELLDKTILDKYIFGAVTFEHDIYRGNFFDTQQQSQEIFTRRGYVLLFHNVLVYWENKWSPFEDWYAHPDVIDQELLQNILKNFSISERTKRTHFECIDIIRECMSS